jgi:tetratricopeptide (TPR) repeat protein
VHSILHNNNQILQTGLKLKLWEADALDNMAYVLSQLRKYPQSLQTFLAALKLAEDKETENNIWHLSKFSIKEDPAVGRLTVLSFCHQDMAGLYAYTGNVQKELSNSMEALKIGEIINDESILSTVNMNIGWLYLRLNKLDSALIYEHRALEYSNTSGFRKYKGQILLRMGNIYFKKGDYVRSGQYYKAAAHQDIQQNNLKDLADVHVGLSYFFSVTGNSDSSLWYAKKGLEIAESAGSPDGVVIAYTSLSAYI